MGEGAALRPYVTCLNCECRGEHHQTTPDDELTRSHASQSNSPKLPASAAKPAQAMKGYGAISESKPLAEDSRF